MEPGDVLALPARAPQQWHQAVRYADPRGKLPLLLTRAYSQLGDRRDVEELRQLIRAITTRSTADRLSADVRRLRDHAEVLLGQHNAAVAAESALTELRPPVRNVQERLDDEDFWPTLFPGLTGSESRAARDFLIDRCFDALRAIDTLVALRELASAAPSAAADDREVWRLKQAQGNALVDAKFAVVKTLRALHGELERYILLPTDPFT